MSDIRQRSMTGNFGVPYTDDGIAVVQRALEKVATPKRLEFAMRAIAAMTAHSAECCDAWRFGILVGDPYAWTCTCGVGS